LGIAGTLITTDASRNGVQKIGAVGIGAKAIVLLIAEAALLAQSSLALSASKPVTEREQERYAHCKVFIVGFGDVQAGLVGNADHTASAPRWQMNSSRRRRD
jgi:hypothetical protein